MWQKGPDCWADTHKLVEQTGSDATKYLRRVVSGWYRNYGASSAFSHGVKIVVTHNSDPDGIRFCRANITYPPTSEVNALHETIDPTNTCYDYWPSDKITIRPKAVVTIVDTLQLPVGMEQHAEHMVCNDHFICKDRYQSDRFIVQSTLLEGGLTTYFYFKKIGDHWEYVNYFTSVYASDTAGSRKGMQCMNADRFVVIKGNMVHVFSCTNDVWTYTQSHTMNGSIFMASIRSTDFLGDCLNHMTMYRFKGTNDPVMTQMRIGTMMDLDTGEENITYATTAYFLSYPESGPDYQLSTIAHGSLSDGFVYMLQQHLTGGLLESTRETCSLLKLWPDTGNISAIYEGPSSGSVFSGDKTESFWQNPYQRDSEGMFLRCKTNEYEMSCQGYLVLEDYYYNLVVPFQTKTGLDPDNPFIYSYYYYPRQLFFFGEEIRTIVGTTMRYLGVSTGGVTYEGALDDSNSFYTRVVDDEWYTNSLDGSGKVFMAEPLLGNYDQNSPAYCVKEFVSQFEVVSVSLISGNSTVPAGTTMKYAFSIDNVAFYYWGGSSWVLCSTIADGNTFGDLQTILPSNPFMASNSNTVFLRVYMETTDPDLTPQVSSLSLTMGTVSVGRAIVADSSMVKMTHLSATETEFESLINEIVLCEAQVSIVAPKYNVMYED